MWLRSHGELDVGKADAPAVPAADGILIGGFNFQIAESHVLDRRLWAALHPTWSAIVDLEVGEAQVRQSRQRDARFYQDFDRGPSAGQYNVGEEDVGDMRAGGLGRR